MGFLGHPHELRFNTQLEHRLEDVIDDASQLLEHSGDFSARFNPKIVAGLSDYAKLLCSILVEDEVAEYDSDTLVQPVLFTGHISSLLKSELIFPDIGKKNIEGPRPEESKIRGVIQEIIEIYLRQNPRIDGLLNGAADMYDPTYFGEANYSSVYKDIAAFCFAQIELSNNKLYIDATIQQFKRELDT